MSDKTNSGMRCAEFDAWLADAIDGVLNGKRKEDFERHKAECPLCGKLFLEATSGREWLKTVMEIDPPQNLVHNILAVTAGVSREIVQAELRPSAWETFRRQLGVVLAPVLTPRFALSVAMAFFSVTLVLNMAQIRIRDLTAHNMSHIIYSSENKVVKHYENMRLVYEIESRVQYLRDLSGENERELRDRRLEEDKNQSRIQYQNNEPVTRQHHEVSFSQNVSMTASLSRGGHDFWTYRGNLAKQRRKI